MREGAGKAFRPDGVEWPSAKGDFRRWKADRREVTFRGQVCAKVAAGHALAREAIQCARGKPSIKCRGVVTVCATVVPLRADAALTGGWERGPASV